MTLVIPPADSRSFIPFPFDHGAIIASVIGGMGMPVGVGDGAVVPDNRCLISCFGRRRGRGRGLAARCLSLSQGILEYQCPGKE